MPPISILLGAKNMGGQQASLAKELIGTWWLIDRIDRAADGSRRAEPTLGADPLAMLTYTKDRFAAQFMRRGRETETEAPATNTPAAAGKNNTSAADGYDAYFGTYRVLENGEVLHKLEASVVRANVGMEVKRSLAVGDNQLTITLATTTKDGEPVTRTLRWSRIG